MVSLNGTVSVRCEAELDPSNATKPNLVDMFDGRYYDLDLKTSELE
jgi:hypothetical protein